MATMASLSSTRLLFQLASLIDRSSFTSTTTQRRRTVSTCLILGPFRRCVRSRNATISSPISSSTVLELVRTRLESKSSSFIRSRRAGRTLDLLVSWNRRILPQIKTRLPTRVSGRRVSGRMLKLEIIEGGSRQDDEMRSTKRYGSAVYTLRANGGKNMVVAAYQSSYEWNMLLAVLILFYFLLRIVRDSW